MPSSIDLCNRALLRLGANKITSFNDNTNESNDCGILFDSIAREVQAMGPWPCNKFRAVLAQSATPPLFGYTYAYALPTDPLCLRVIEVSEDNLGEVEYQVENGFILTDNPTLGILYVGYLTDTNSFDVYLQQAVIWRLVTELAYKYIGSADVAMKLVDTAQKAIDDLIAIASLQGSTTDIPSDTFIDPRLQGAGGPQEPFSGG